MTRRPNILMIVTDEERAVIPRPQGFSLPARERMAERGATFDRYYTASAMCSSARSVVYTGQHLPLTEIYDNDNMPYVRPLDPRLGTLGTMLREAGYYCTYQGKWHLSNAYVTPQNPGPTTNALEPYGFSEFNDWGDIDGGAWAGLTLDPVIAGQAVRWLRNRAPLVEADQPWFMAVNFVNPHDIMSFDYGGSSQVRLPFGLAHAVVAKAAANIPIYQRRWDLDLPASLHDDLSGAAPAVAQYARMLDTVFGLLGWPTWHGDTDQPPAAAARPDAEPKARRAQPGGVLGGQGPAGCHARRPSTMTAVVPTGHRPATSPALLSTESTAFTTASCRLVRAARSAGTSRSAACTA